jgi:autotransporter-associated beta strand protein
MNWISKVYLNRWCLAALPGCIIVLVMLAVSCTELRAQSSIYSNNITGTNPNTANPFTAGQSVHGDITVSGLGRGSGAIGTGANDRYNANSWDTSSLDPSAYFTWTLAPDDGFSIDLLRLSGAWQRSGSGATQYQLRSSLDGFTSSIVAGAITGSGSSATFNLDLSSTLFDNITAGIEFRLYAWGASASGGTFSINDFSFFGEVNPIVVVPNVGNYWDTNGATAGVGGSGNWTTSGTTWNIQAGTATPNAFDPTTELIFTGTAGTVNLTEAISHEGNLRFEATGYTLEGEALGLNPSGTPFITVTTAGHVATINNVIEGFSGLAKAGAGTLVLGGMNTFSGDVAINAGVLQITSDDNLGATSNGIVLGGGTLKTTADVSLHEERATATGGHAISGAGGLDVADGTTLTVNGTTSLTALTLSNSGTVDLQGATNDLGAVTVSGNATVKGNDASAANITASHAGTATIQNNLNLGAVDRTITVNNAAAVLALKGVLSGARIIKAGAGTLEATGDNAGLSLGFQLGSAGAAPTNGGTLKIGHKNGLGTSAQFRFNYGTLYAVTDLTGENAMANSLSIGGRTGAAAAFDGNNMEINGSVGFFRGTGTTGQLELNTMNTTTLNGDRAADSGTGTATGITLGGTGKLILNGNWSSNTYAVTLAQSVTTEINNLFTGNVTVGDNNASGGTTPTLQGRGTLTGAVTVNSDGRLKIGSTGDTAARVMTISGNLTSSGTMEFDLFSGGTGGEAGSSDKLAFGSGTTSVNLSGTLVINNADLDFGTTPWADGSFWQLIDWGTVQQANRTVNYSTITLPEIAGYEWINTLSTDGRITLSAVPEPGRMVLLLLGGGLLLIQRRRRHRDQECLAGV